jgi:hypothetical protein
LLPGFEAGLQVSLEESSELVRIGAIVRRGSYGSVFAVVNVGGVKELTFGGRRRTETSNSEGELRVRGFLAEDGQWSRPKRTAVFADSAGSKP